MPYLELFQRAAKHVESQGCEVTFVRGRPVTKAAVGKARKTSILPLPDSLIAFYEEVGNGLEFSWSVEDDGGPSALLTIPKLTEVIAIFLNGMNERQEWDDTNAYAFTDNPKLARRTALKMRKWLGFYEVGNGDRFCFDTAALGSPIVYDQHDWMDSGTGANGHQLGPSLDSFLASWSKVCFQSPSRLWWPGVFHKRRGVDWRSDEFREPFRLLLSRSK
jgi:hypothetical protein